MRRAPRVRASRPHSGRLAVWPVLLLVAALAAGMATTVTTYASAPLVVGGKAVVTGTGGDPIRVRQGAGTEYAHLFSAYEGQIVSVLAGPSKDPKGNTWFKVQASLGTGWMSAEFLQGTTATAVSSTRLTGSARVSNTDGDPLRVREAPTAGTAGKILTLLDPGTVVDIKAGPVTDSTGIVWYQITAKGITGWAMAQYLSQIEADRAQGTSRGSTRPAPTPTRVATPRPPASTRPTATPAPRPTTAAAPAPTGRQSGLAQYRQWVGEARTLFPYPQSADKMWRVMMCESSGNPLASGGGGAWLGLFQYTPGTWAGWWNPYRANSIWDARSQIFATAKAWSIGMQGSWSCFYSTVGN